MLSKSSNEGRFQVPVYSLDELVSKGTFGTKN